MVAGHVNREAGAIGRESLVLGSKDVTASLSTTDKINKTNYAGIGITVPSGSSLTSLEVHVSNDGETFHRLVDSDGTDVSVTVAAGKAYLIPSEVWPFPYVKFVGNASGSVSVVIVG